MYKDLLEKLTDELAVEPDFIAAGANVEDCEGALVCRCESREIAVLVRAALNEYVKGRDPLPDELVAFLRTRDRLD